MKRTLILGVVMLLAVPAAHAGIVITKGGKVFLGRIEADDRSDRTLVLREPRLRQGETPVPGSKMTLDRSEVRWLDEKADEPTDAYFKAFLDDPLDPAWAWAAEQFRERQKFVPVTPGAFRARLVALPTTRLFDRCEVSVRRPVEWTVTEKNEIVMFESLDKRARIHFYASDLTGERALTVARDALKNVGTRVDSTETNANGSEWLTTLERKTRTVKALRRIVQTDKSTAFAVAYADERDFERLSSLLRESLDTLKAREVVAEAH
ncbi:MAG: hypothetical protein ACAI25_13800 [Planctomycetota bacterium]